MASSTVRLAMVDTVLELTNKTDVHCDVGVVQPQNAVRRVVHPSLARLSLGWSHEFPLQYATELADATCWLAAAARMDA